MTRQPKPPLHSATLQAITHSHQFGSMSIENERRTLYVVILTALTMIAEVIFGYLTGSMALLADGWHMGTHTLALGISYAAYVLARRFSQSTLFAFGTGKFGVLAGYSSALFLGSAAVLMIWQSIMRFVHPVEIAFNQAILVTSIGLAVNLVSIRILHGGGEHGHEHEHEHDYDNGESGKHGREHDHSFRAAYLHVIADALTSVFALVALTAGKYAGWVALDPIVGVLGGIMICRWALQLIKSTALILLDGGIERAMSDTIRQTIESDGDSRVADLHVWRVGSVDAAAIVSVVTGEARSPSDYTRRLTTLPNLQHITVEVHSCRDEDCHTHCICGSDKEHPDNSIRADSR